jgi:hypothetical protein
MAAKRAAWTLTETLKLIENYDKPIQILDEMFPRHSKPSIDRKMNRLRKDGKIGVKSEETIQESYRLRHSKSPSLGSKKIK